MGYCLCNLGLREAIVSPNIQMTGQLRELTGRDTEPTPDAWRRLLKISAESQRKTETP